MFLIFTICTFVIVILSIIGMIKQSKKQKSVEEEWAKFIEKHPSKNEKNTSQTK